MNTAAIHYRVSELDVHGNEVCYRIQGPGEAVIKGKYFGSLTEIIPKIRNSVQRLNKLERINFNAKGPIS